MSRTARLVAAASLTVSGSAALLLVSYLALPLQDRPRLFVAAAAILFTVLITAAWYMIGRLLGHTPRILPGVTVFACLGAGSVWGMLLGIATPAETVALLGLSLFLIGFGLPPEKWSSLK